MKKLLTSLFLVALIGTSVHAAPPATKSPAIKPLVSVIAFCMTEEAANAVIDMLIAKNHAAYIERVGKDETFPCADARLSPGASPIHAIMIGHVSTRVADGKAYSIYKVTSVSGKTSAYIWDVKPVVDA